MLKINNLSCGYNSKFFLKDISCEVLSNDFIGIIGPNGSGKTTLLRAITKIIPIKGGDILLSNESIKKLSFKRLSREMAVVTQTPDTMFKLTVEEFVSLGRIAHLKNWQFFETKHDQDIVNQAMDLVGITEFKNRLFFSLSGGEQQLAVIAKAIAQEPKLILLDEPTNHLDIAHQVKILDLIKRLNKKNGLTVMIVLHDLNLASQYCNKLILLDCGNIYAQGRPEDVLTTKIIKEVYKTEVVVKTSNFSAKPFVFLVPQNEIDSEGDNLLDVEC